MSAPYTMQALQELADDGVHLLEIDDAGLVATVQELDALRARVAELERAQDAAFRDAHRAEADAARLREALTQVRDAMLATGQEPDGDDDPRRPVAAAVWRALASAPNAEPTPRAKAEAFFAGFAGDDDAGVLAWSEPSAEPTPRDMRVAEALEGLTAWLSRWRHAITIRAEGAAQAWDELERLHNTGIAVVAKAVKP